MQSIINSTYLRNNKKLHNGWPVDTQQQPWFASLIRGSSTSGRSSLSRITIESILIFNPVSWRVRYPVTARFLRPIKILVGDPFLLAAIARRFLLLRLVLTPSNGHEFFHESSNGPQPNRFLTQWSPDDIFHILWFVECSRSHTRFFLIVGTPDDHVYTVTNRTCIWQRNGKIRGICNFI